MANEKPGITPGTAEKQDGRAESVLGRLLKLVFVLVIFAAIGLTGYAYLADLSPAQTEITVPVTLNAD